MCLDRRAYFDDRHQCRADRGERRTTRCKLEDSMIEAVIVSTARTPIGKAYRGERGLRGPEQRCEGGPDPLTVILDHWVSRNRRSSAPHSRPRCTWLQRAVLRTCRRSFRARAT